jgi:hypothetical protein
MEHLDRILETRDDVRVQEVPGDPAHEQIAAAGVESQFGRDARIGATENACERVLTLGQRLALVLEVVPPGNAFDIALITLHEALQRGLRRQDVLQLRRGFRRLGESVARDRQAGHRGASEREEATSRDTCRMNGGRVGT